MKANSLFSNIQEEIEYPVSEDIMSTDGMILIESDFENSNQSYLQLKKSYDALSASYESMKKQILSFHTIYKVVVCVKNDELKKTISQDINALYLYYVLLKSPESASSYLKQDWQFFFHWTNILSNQFYNRFMVAFPFLDWKAVRLCCLIRTGFTDRDIAIQLSVKETSIHRQKNRLKVQFPCSFKTVRAFEEFINSF